MNFSFAIIGGGLTGVSMIFQFVEKIREKAQRGRLDPSEISIRMFERQDVFGPGFPHSEKNAMPCHLINMCAQDMGIISGRPEDFQLWAHNHRKVIKEQFKWMPRLDVSDFRQPRCDYYPRFVMGEYLKGRFGETLQKARNLGLKVELFPGCEVTDLLEESAGVRLEVKNLHNGERFSTHADRALIATGHWFEEEERAGYFASPWPGEKLQKGIPKGERVAVIGSSLSALDAALALTSDGEFVRDDHGRLRYLPPAHPKKIRLYSRRGLLPKVRGKTGVYRNKFLTLENVKRLTVENNGQLPLNDAFRLLESDLVAAYGHRIDWAKVLDPPGTSMDRLRDSLKDAKEGDGPHGALLWQTVLTQTFPLVRRLYTLLSPEDRERFVRNYDTLFFSYAAPMPLINGEKLLALMESGTVDVVRLGNEYRFMKQDPKGWYAFVYRNHQFVEERDRYRYVIDARGQDKSYETNSSELARNLLGSGTVQIEALPYFDQRKARHGANDDDQEKPIQTYITGSIWIDPETHHLVRIGKDGRRTVSDRVYAVGPMTRGQIIDASMAYASAVSTAGIAEDLIGFLEKPQS